MRRLTEGEFKATAVPEKERVGLDEEPPFDFREYFELIPPEEFSEHDFSEGRVSYAWNMRVEPSSLDWRVWIMMTLSEQRSRWPLPLTGARSSRRGLRAWLRGTRVGGVFGRG